MPSVSDSWCQIYTFTVTVPQIAEKTGPKKFLLLCFTEKSQCELFLSTDIHTQLALGSYL